jgi:hypothetical protein
MDDLHWQGPPCSSPATAELSSLSLRALRRASISGLLAVPTACCRTTSAKRQTPLRGATWTTSKLTRPGVYSVRDADAFAAGDAVVLQPGVYRCKVPPSAYQPVHRRFRPVCRPHRPHTEFDRTVRRAPAGRAAHTSTCRGWTRRRPLQGSRRSAWTIGAPLEETTIVNLELPRFRGHLTMGSTCSRERSSHGENETALHAGVPC